MKKIIKKVKGKKVLSFVLAAIMLATTFNMALPMLKLDASAALQYDSDGNIVIDGVTQKRVVETDGSYARTYAGYASDYLNGASMPTDIVVPGLDPDEDYVIQGMTYYPKEDWFFVTAYYNGKNVSSKVFCLDAATGEFVAMISFLNVDGTDNTDHGGGIAISENNIYYSCGDKDRKIAYAPLSALEGITVGEHRKIQLVGEIDFYELGDAFSAYVCYDQGVLWMGNFFDTRSTDYGKQANKDWDSMVFGYRLSGSTSAEEWANLTSNTQNCQGNPSYVIALGDDSTTGIDITWVQYATVDNGKLYLSRSASTGNNTTGFYDEYSHLSVADIDLTTPGTQKITFPTDAAGTQREVDNAYVLSSYHDYPMMPMSEGLCVVDDYIYITYEGASNKFLNEADDGIAGVVNGNCKEPVDVVWKLDQYALVGAERPDTEELLHYEQITDLSQIEDNEDYLIVFESAEKNPVTQKPYLYALDSHGGLKGNYLSKHDSGDTAGYDAMIGHKISNYSIEDSLLYLYNPEEDDIPNIRWQISGATNGNLRIKNADTYFTDYCYFYFDKATISMADSSVTDLSSMSFTPAGNGSFYLTNNGSYLWCNDFTVDGYEAAANKWYSDNSGTAMYNGVTETKGTFHTDALYSDNTNILGKSILESEYYLGQFKIFKRTVDPYLSTKESRVYTDMDAELQADGTYTISLDTYATGEIQYQVLEQERPTDFIFVLDTSASMTNNSDCSGYRSYDGTGNNVLRIESLAPSDATEKDYSISTGYKKGVIGYKFSNKPIYYKDYTDGTYYPLYSAVYTTTCTATKCEQYYWAYYIGKDNLYYVLNSDGTVDAGISYETFKSNVDNVTNASAYVNNNTNTNRKKTVVFAGEHWEYFANSSATRLEAMQTACERLTYNIAQDATLKGFDHRIALVQYGSNGDEGWINTGMYNNSSTAMLQYSGEGTISATNYANAYYNVDQFATVRDIIWKMNTSAGDTDTYSNYGFDMANGIIANSGKDYLATGDRSLAIITITDGVPGLGGNDVSKANTVAELAVQETYQAKCNGANIYAVQIGNNACEGFSMNLYMDAISSEYPTAKSLTDLGEKNPTDVQYHMDVATGTLNMFDVIANNLTTSIQKNSTFGYTELTADSILREQLSNAFVVPKKADGTLAEGVGVSYSLTPGWYDAIDRIHWGESQTTADVTGTYDNERTLLVTGYDYSKNFISHSKTQANPGYMLTVTITGVLANEAADLTNTSINNDDNTAIYQDQDWLAANYAFKHYPRKYFTIPEYTYVLDYGFDMYDSDVNGTIKALANTLDKQDTSNYTESIDSGMVEIKNNYQDLLYRHNPVYAQDSGYVLIQRDNGKYDWFEIKVVPASNVLYEESALKIENGEDGNAYHWNKKGEPEITYQDLSTENDVYGYDNHYANSTTFSNGTYYYSTVDKQNILSDVASVTFKGTGFELLAACGETTGIQLVAIKKFDENTNKWKTIQAYFADTYYKGDMLADEDALLYQVPVVKWEGTEYGEYKVEVSGFYASGAGAIKKSGVKNNLIDTGLVMNTAQAENSINIETMLAQAGIEDLEPENVELVWFDDNSVFNGGTGPAPVKKATRASETTDTTDTTLHNYVDGFRIYNPLEDTSNYIEKERDPQYINVLNNLMTAGDTVGNIAYIVGTMDNLTWKDYNKVGPQDEVYLKSGTEQTTEGISFNTNVAPGGRVMISLRAVNGVATTAKINGREIKVNSATEMYYDITDVLDVDNTNTANVTVINTGDGILSVNNIKLTNTVSPAKLMMFNMDDMETVNYYASMEPIKATVENGVVTPVEEEEEIPEDNTNTDTDTEESENEEFSLFSIIEMLIAFIEKILYSAFGAGSIA